MGGLIPLPVGELIPQFTGEFIPRPIGRLIPRLSGGLFSQFMGQLISRLLRKLFSQLMRGLPRPERLAGYSLEPKGEVGRCSANDERVLPNQRGQDLAEMEKLVESKTRYEPDPDFSPPPDDTQSA